MHLLGIFIFMTWDVGQGCPYMLMDSLRNPLISEAFVFINPK